MFSNFQNGKPYLLLQTTEHTRNMTSLSCFKIIRFAIRANFSLSFLWFFGSCGLYITETIARWVSPDKNEERAQTIKNKGSFICITKTILFF